MTFAHSLITTAPMPFSAIAAPVIPAISECDFEAGMPWNQQNTPHPMDATMAAMSAISAKWGSPVKSTMLNIVWATAVEM